MVASERPPAGEVRVRIPKSSARFRIPPRPPDIDYPRNLGELETLFPDENACRRYLERLRWPSGFVCPSCAEPGVPERSHPGLLACRRCQRVCSPISGTLFHGTEKPMRLWFRALWEVAAREGGSSGASLCRLLGLRRIEEAWSCLERLRGAMVDPERDRLSGAVELGHLHVEISESGRAPEIALIALAIESGDEPGRARIARLDSAAPSAVARFCRDAIEHGSEVHTSDWSGYVSLASAGFRHVMATDDVPNVRHLTAVLRLWMWGVPELTVRRLGYYLDELTFRLNFGQGGRREPGAIFLVLLHLAAQPLQPRAAERKLTA